MAHMELTGTVQPPWQRTDDAAFRERLIELMPYLRALARKLSKHPELGDDLCQETLARAWASRATFQPATNFKAWVFAILRNHLYSEARRSWRAQPWDAGLAEQTLVTHASQESALALSDVRRAMHFLPDDQREALILVAIGGMSYREGANVCKCAIGTIKSRVARARRALETKCA